MAFEKDCNPEEWYRIFNENDPPDEKLFNLLNSLRIAPAQELEEEKEKSPREKLLDSIKKADANHKFIEELDPLVPFATLPHDFFDKIDWHATQIDFLAFVHYCITLDILTGPNGRDDIDKAGALFVQYIDIDLHPYPDFRSMRIVLQRDIEKAYLAQKHK